MGPKQTYNKPFSNSAKLITLGFWKTRTHSNFKWLDPCVHAKSLQSCPTLCMDCSPPGSSVPGILQAGILKWVAISSSRGSSWFRVLTHVSYLSCIGRWVLLPLVPPRKPGWICCGYIIWLKRQEVSYINKLPSYSVYKAAKAIKPNDDAFLYF